MEQMATWSTRGLLRELWASLWRMAKNGSRESGEWIFFVDNFSEDIHGILCMYVQFHSFSSFSTLSLIESVLYQIIYMKRMTNDLIMHELSKLFIIVYTT